MDILYIRYNERLTLLAKKIFGDDVVDKAYVSCLLEGTEQESELPIKLDECSKEVLLGETSCSVSFTENSVLIKFVGGKMVEFYTSDDGGGMETIQTVIEEVREDGSGS